MAHDPKQELVDFLERRVFRPVLDARGDGGGKLDRLQDATQRQLDRYLGCESAARVRQEFEDDVGASPERGTQEELRGMELPTLADVKDEFLSLCDRVGVRQGERKPERPRAPHSQHRR
jgi:hypothetical protein